MAAIALRMLLADRRKLVAALLGVAFSVVLVNIQGGLFVGLIRKASLLIDHSEADIWIGHEKIHNVDFAKDIPQRWLQRIEGLPEIAAAAPYIVGYQLMTLPDGGYEMVVVVGVDPVTMLGNAWSIHAGDPGAIRQPATVIVDVNDRDKIGDVQLGDTREIGAQRVRIVALSQGILGFVVTPYVFSSFHDAARILNKSSDACSYILLRTHEGVDVEALCSSIRARLPHAAVYSKDEYSRLSQGFWLKRTGIGIGFGAATALGLLVGLAVVGQSLYTSVVDRLGEFGTLLAIGAEPRQLLRLLWLQAFFLASVGIFMGLSVAFSIQTLFSLPRAPIVIPWQLSLGSCALTLLSCLVCATIPYLRIRKVDPALIL